MEDDKVLPMLTDKLDLAAIDLTTRDKLAEEKTKYRSLHIQTYEHFEIGKKRVAHAGHCASAKSRRFVLHPGRQWQGVHLMEAFFASGQ